MMTPISDATTGLASDVVATAGASWPVARAPCWIRNATTPATHSAQARQSVTTTERPSSNSSTTGFASDAESPYSRPATVPSAAARRAGRALRPASITPAASRVTTATLMAHSQSGASLTPAAGAPTTMNVASAATTPAAAAQSRRVTTWWVSSTPSGSAKTTVVTRSGWMITSRPFPSAAPWTA